MKEQKKDKILDKEKKEVAETPVQNKFVKIPQMRRCITDSSFKLVINGTLEAKIRYLCDKFPGTEWSGIMFYKEQSGNIEDKNLVLEAMDFYLLDVGTAAYTEYETTPEVLGYQIENDLLDCWWCIIHSHNVMATFFSGTDMNTLGSIGNTMNHFLSLIVNNKGEYNARLTRKVKETMNCDVNATYKSFGDEDRKFNYKTSEDDEALEWIEASIEKMKPKKMSKDEKKLLDARIASIDDEKERIRKERQNDLKQTRYVTQHWSWDDLDDIYDTHADIDNDFTWSWRSDLGKDMHKDIDANKFVYTLITGDMFPMNNVVNTNMNEVVSRALKVYNVKKRSITNALSCYGGIEMYVDHVMSYYGLFFDELEVDDTANEILSSLSKYSVISDWVDELYQTLLSYEYYE